MRLSKLTISLGIYIVVSAAFMLQVRKWLFDVFGEPVVVASFKTLFLIALILATLYAQKIRLSMLRICAGFSIFVLGYFFATWQPYFSEKAHVLTYGLLGFLTSSDLINGRNLKSRLKNTALTISCIVLIGASDETFQWFLPYRVGEIRDFVTNVMSGILGVGLFFALKKA